MFKKGTFNPNDTDGNAWLRKTAECCPLQHIKLVEFHESHLIELGLLNEKYAPRPERPEFTQIRPGDTNRLTDLALALCEFIQE